MIQDEHAEQPRAVYINKSDRFSHLRDVNTRRIQQLGFMRLIFFVLFGWQSFVFVRAGFTGTAGWYALSALGIFIALLLLTFRYQQRKKHYALLFRINENELTMLSGGHSFLDDGTAPRAAPSYATDLSIFGKGSLFHKVNRCATLTGKTQLASRFLHPFTDASSITACQQAAGELATLVDFRQELLATALQIEKEEGFAQLKAGIDSDRYSSLTSVGIKWLAILWPLTGAALFIYSLATNQYRLLLLFMIAGLVVAGLLVRHTGELYTHVSKRGYLYTGYAACFSIITRASFKDSYLQSLQQRTEQAEKAFAGLSRIVSWYDLRLNLLLSPFANGLFLTDLLCARAYLKWHRQYQSSVPGWFETLGEMEALASIACFHYNHPSFIFPHPVHDRMLVEATGAGHPLMDEAKAVRNNITLGTEGRLHLITGSNMSGKSTYLRAVGLNLLLAQAGAPVFAASFRFTPMQLLTSFHHIDSLEESTSYFYAELKSLQQIMQMLDNGHPSLVLLDEVMRGTNSKDKHDGTALLMDKLLTRNCLAMIATHDTALGILAERSEGAIENFCFESELSAEGLTFDFKRKNGVAQATNATYLMKQMGIV